MYANVDEDDVDMNKDGEHFVGNQDNIDFINNSNISVDENFYREFENASGNLDEPVDDYLDWIDHRDLQPENYLVFDTQRDKIEFDEFDNVKARAKKFRSKCFLYEKGSKDSFYNAVLYAIVFKLSYTKHFITDENEIEKIIGKETFHCFKKIKH